jgi:carbon monoxide dehydrogenase subunit G
MKLSFRVHKNLDLVFGYLTDMQKFVSAHPVISQIDNIGSENYLVHETLKFGFILFSFTYPVTIEKNTIDKTVIIRATVFKLTKIEMKFVLRADNDYTIIDEEINFKSPLPVKFIMQSIFKKQHDQLFKNIEMDKMNMEEVVPDEIGGARVLYFIITGSTIRPAGNTKQIVGGTLLGPAYGLAICKYENESGYYLFGCDNNWNSITDTHHETIEDAIDQGEFEYEGTRNKWMAK